MWSVCGEIILCFSYFFRKPAKAKDNMLWLPSHTEEQLDPFLQVLLRGRSRHSLQPVTSRVWSLLRTRTNSSQPNWAVYRMSLRFHSLAGVSSSWRKSPAHPDEVTQVGHSWRMLGRPGHLLLGVWNLTNHDVVTASRLELRAFWRL